MFKIDKILSLKKKQYIDCAFSAFWCFFVLVKSYRKKKKKKKFKTGLITPLILLLPPLLLFDIICSFHSSAISLSSLRKTPIKQNLRQSTKTGEAGLNSSRSTISLKKSCHQPILSYRSFDQHALICWLCVDRTIKNEFTELLSPTESRSKI